MVRCVEQECEEENEASVPEEKTTKHMLREKRGEENPLQTAKQTVLV